MKTAAHGFLNRKGILVAKLFALIIAFLLFTVWLYYAYAPSILRRTPLMMYPADVVVEEIARLDNLGSFLSALFQGNLGYSFYYGPPVWGILVGSLGTTVLLIIISIAISVATGALVTFVAARFMPKGYMPLVSVYSLRGYFFALTTWTGIIVLLIFAYHLGWLPLGRSQPDYWLMHPPENVLVEIEGRLRHLVLPMLTLTIIFVIRNLLVVWSGGTRFTSEKTLRNLVLPLTTTDFACIISAVVLVEYAFVLPGVGRQFFASVGSGDLNMIVGAFLVLLAIAMILGYLGVFLDFVRQHYGLLDEPEKEVRTETQSKERPQQNVSNLQLKGLLRLLLNKKRVLLGLLIVSSFVIIGLAAPFLAPYDPVSISVTPKIAYKLSKPVWYKYLFPGENLSENIDATSDPYFNSADAINKLSLETSLANQGSIHTEYISDRGFPEGSGLGCMAIVFSRDADVAPHGEVKTNLTVTVNYPYSFPPQQFSGQVAVLVDDPQDVSKEINVVLEKTGSSRIILWSEEDFKTHTDDWATPYPPINSENFDTKNWLGRTLGFEWYKSPARAMFSESGDYRFTLEIAFEDTLPGASNITVYVDDFFLRLYGNSFGLLGTDEYGRDIFPQILYGARSLLVMAFPMAVVAAFIGLALGSASHFGSLIDGMTRLFADTTLALPVVPLLVVVSLPLYPGSLDWGLLWVLSALAAMASRTAYMAHKSEKALMGGALRSRLFDLFRGFSANFCFLMVSLTLLSLIGGFGPWLGLDSLEPKWSGMLVSALYSAHTFDALWLWVPPLSCLMLFAVGFFLVGLGLDERV